MKIITGKTEKEHVTSEDDRGLYAGIIGSQSYVLNVGKKFEASTESANVIRIKSGDLVHNGCHARIPVGEVDNKISTLVNAITTAQRTANTGVEKADAAQNAANEAQSTADTAVSKANAAQSTADSASSSSTSALNYISSLKTSFSNISTIMSNYRQTILSAGNLNDLKEGTASVVYALQSFFNDIASL